MERVVGIATRVKTKAPMVEHTSATISFDRGVGDDSRGLIKGNRQVTVMAKESWDAVCSELGAEIPWTTRRANILIEGIDLKESTGQTLRIGDSHLKIMGELVPCQRMDDQFEGLRNALAKDWRGGVHCKVMSEGTVQENDKVCMLTNE